MAGEKKGKTATIKKRALYIYLPSEGMVEEWKRLAREAGVSVSKFVQEHVHSSLCQERGKDFAPRHIIQKNLRECEEENDRLKKEVRKLEALAERLDTELRQYRLQSFNQEAEGTRTFDPELIDLFKRRSFVGSDELLPALGISPRDTDSVRSINSQVSLLENFGLVEPTVYGWRWKG